jgi:hypothetical protein
MREANDVVGERRTSAMLWQSRATASGAFRAGAWELFGRFLAEDWRSQQDSNLQPTE